MGILKRLWCYSVLIKPGTLYVPFLALWLGTAIGVNWAGQDFWVQLFYPGKAYLMLFLFLSGLNVVETAGRQLVRGRRLGSRFMGSVSIFEAITVSTLAIVLSFRIADLRWNYFSFFTLVLFFGLVVLPLDPFDLRERGVFSSLYRAFLFGFLVPVWGASRFKYFPSIPHIYVGALLMNYLFGVYITKDYIQSALTLHKGVTQRIYMDLNWWVLFFVFFSVSAPFFSLPAAYALGVFPRKSWEVAPLGAVLGIYGVAIFGYLLGKKELKGEHVAKVHLHFHLILFIAVIALVTYGYR